MRRCRFVMDAAWASKGGHAMAFEQLITELFEEELAGKVDAVLKSKGLLKRTLLMFNRHWLEFGGDPRRILRWWM
ncbi:hypothetical protein RIF29_29530 [Crotalaria pallida]|uniref:Uncharacterized protein n=1 Tax=Crotalaria pallida TaxID=3830 RepID=A0AAN9EH31_CROPI